MTIALRQRPLSRVVMGIVKANNGAWFDPSDLSTLYQDAAGTVPVTAVEQPVGKILDKSGNGNHATQSVTASRPVLSARYNLLTKTEDFSGAVWTKYQSTVTTNAYLAPNGTMSAGKICETLNASSQYCIQTNIAGVAGNTYTYSVYLHPAERTWASLNFYTPSTVFSFAYFDLVNGVVGNTGGVTATISPVGNGWFKCSITKSLIASENLVVYTFTSIGNLATGTTPYAGVAGYGLYAWGQQLVIGTTSGPYQRVNTATDYDTDPRYFPKYLRFDGVDDYLNLPYMGLYAGGACSVIATQTAYIQAADAYLISECSNSSGIPQYCPVRQIFGNSWVDSIVVTDTNSWVIDTVGWMWGGVPSITIRSCVDSGDRIKSFKNTEKKEDDFHTRSGTLTLNNTTIGAIVGLSARFFMKMNLYSFIITKSALTDAQRIKCERYAASKAGVIL